MCSVIKGDGDNFFDGDFIIHEEDDGPTQQEQVRWLSSLKREIKPTVVDDLMIKIVSIFDDDLKQELNRIFNSLDNDNRETVQAMLVGLVLTSITHCPNSSQASTWQNRMKIKAAFDSILEDLNNNDRQILNSAQEKVQTSIPKLCEIVLGN